MHMNEYMILAKKNTSDVRGLNVLITGYILSARKHGAASIKRGVLVDLHKSSKLHQCRMTQFLSILC
jgi:hypothetical protein